MEDTLRETKRGFSGWVRCLNPCFNGRYSQSCSKLKRQSFRSRLNPCFNGRYSQSVCKNAEVTNFKSLNPCFNGRYSQRLYMFLNQEIFDVLILVLMEDTLRVYFLETIKIIMAKS